MVKYKKQNQYTMFFRWCDKSCADVTVDYGVVTMIDKDGAVILSGSR